MLFPARTTAPESDGQELRDLAILKASWAGERPARDNPTNCPTARRTSSAHPDPRDADRWSAGAPGSWLGLALFGAASGPVPPFDPQRLNAAGSVYLTRPTIGHYIATRAELLLRSGELFAAVAAGSLDVRIGATFPLADAAEAHRALEGRATTGKVLLLP